MKSIILSCLLVLVLLGCTSNDEIVIQGLVDGGKGKTLVLHHIQSTGMEVIDSATLKNNEKFKFQVQKGEYPEFYYLRLANENGLTLMTDTTAKISVSTNAARFVKDAKIEGSPSSVALHAYLLSIKAERKNYLDFVAAYMASPNGEDRTKLLENYSSELVAFKDSVGRQILKNPWSMVSYYVLYQKLNDNYLLFDPYVKEDYKYFGAVATGLNVEYPNDPRVEAFYKMTLLAFKNQRASELNKLIEEAEVGIPDIALPNLKGDTIRLSDFKGKVVVLNFWSSQSGESRRWNNILKKAYSSYKKSGVEIYQVSLDKSNVLWEKALIEDGINWTSVCDYNTGSVPEARSYNVQRVPTTYIIDRNGDVTGKFETEKTLIEAIKRAL